LNPCARRLRRTVGETPESKRRQLVGIGLRCVPDDFDFGERSGVVETVEGGRAAAARAVARASSFQAHATSAPQSADAERTVAI
jgi:hypothetical protein